MQLGALRRLERSRQLACRAPHVTRRTCCCRRRCRSSSMRAPRFASWPSCRCRTPTSCCWPSRRARWRRWARCGRARGGGKPRPSPRVPRLQVCRLHVLVDDAPVAAPPVRPAVPAAPQALIPFYTGRIIDYASIDPNPHEFKVGGPGPGMAGRRRGAPGRRGAAPAGLCACDRWSGTCMPCPPHVAHPAPQATTLKMLGVALGCAIFTGIRGGLFTVRRRGSGALLARAPRLPCRSAERWRSGCRQPARSCAGPPSRRARLPAPRWP